MESIDYEEEEQIFSEGNKQQRKINNFKEYLVNSGTIQHFVKCNLALNQSSLASGPNNSTIKVCPTRMPFKCLESILGHLPQIPPNRTN